MRKLALCLFFLLSLNLTSFAAYEEGWNVASLHSEIDIATDGKVNIIENILADFTNETHKGLARIIPYKYDDGLTEFNARLNFESATDETGQSWANTVSKDGRFLNIEMRTQNLSELTGPATFIVNYTAENVFLFFDDHDEFYWNVNGTDWPVPFKEISATINLPKEFASEEIKLDCFTGYQGEKGKDCEFKITDSKTVTFRTTRELKAYENFTIVLGLPPNTITIPLEKVSLWWITQYWGLIFFPLVLLIMFRLWYKKGRDEKTAKDTVMPHYRPPEGLSPIETGTLIDEKLNNNDIIATIIDYAVKGFIKITETESKLLFIKSVDYELELLKEFKADSKETEIILNELFPHNTAGEKIKISALQNKFYKKIPEITKATMEDLVSQGFFKENPSSVRKKYFVIGAVMGIVGFHGLAGIGILNGIMVMLSAFVIMLFSNYMPRKTTKGAETYYVLKGLYEFINTAEKDRMKFQENNNILFEKLLPYAMAFGLIEKWTKAFEGILKNPPAWFVSTHGWRNGFSMDTFADSVNGMSHQMSNTIASKPGGSGGGFGGGGSSGGGFGGGGGHGL